MAQLTIPLALGGALATATPDPATRSTPMARITAIAVATLCQIAVCFTGAEVLVFMMSSLGGGGPERRPFWDPWCARPLQARSKGAPTICASCAGPLSPRRPEWGSLKETATVGR